MAQMETLHDAFLDELRDAYDAEKQLLKALPRMAKAQAFAISVGTGPRSSSTTAPISPHTRSSTSARTRPSASG